MQNFQLPADYVARLVPDYFNDSQFADRDIIYQPEVYEAADYLVRSTGRTTIIDLGCGCARKLRTVSGTRHVGVDFGSNIESCRKQFPQWGEWIEADFSHASCMQLAELADEQAIIICSDVIEHLSDPSHLASLLKACFERGAIVLTSTPDRLKLWGADYKGPPPNPSHIREWALSEYVSYLATEGLPTFWAGYTYNNNIDRRSITILTIHDPGIVMERLQQRTRPLAILSAFNEGDIIEEVARDWVEQGCDIHILDNWSTDDTYAIATKLQASFPAAITVERFPAEPTNIYQWEKILRRKEEIAAACPGRWIIHTDADEIRRAPDGIATIAEGLSIAEAYGSNRVGFNLINYRPTTGAPFEPGTLTSAFQHFEFGSLPGHFIQLKAWLQGAARIDLATSGGHKAQFDDARNFPYKFLLKHYPIRSQDHGRRKIFDQRQGRWDPAERARGWHVQYDQFDPSSSFVWDAGVLQLEGPDFWAEHGYAVMTDALQSGLRKRDP